MPDAGPVGDVLQEGSEILLRQVHPTHLPEGKLSKGAFIPGPGHDSLLSTMRERVGAKAAYSRWVAQGHASAGTWGVAVHEAHGENLVCLDDGTALKMPDHASISFQGCGTKGETMRRARKLRDFADDRKQLYQP